MPSVLGIDPAAHCWAEITCGTPLFETMCKFLGHHADRSFAPNIENKELAVAEEMFGTDKTPRTVALSCGLGLTTLQHKTVGGDTVTVKVLRQRRGPIVATRCGWSCICTGQRKSLSRRRRSRPQEPQ